MSTSFKVGGGWLQLHIPAVQHPIFVPLITRSQAVARIANHTASQQTI